MNIKKMVVTAVTVLSLGTMGSAFALITTEFGDNLALQKTALVKLGGGKTAYVTKTHQGIMVRNTSGKPLKITTIHLVPAHKTLFLTGAKKVIIPASQEKLGAPRGETTYGL